MNDVTWALIINVVVATIVVLTTYIVLNRKKK